MYTSNLALYLNSNSLNISPIVNIETLYYELAVKNGSTDYNYVIRQNVTKHMPIGYMLSSVDHSQYMPTDDPLKQYSRVETYSTNYKYSFRHIYKKDTSIYNGSTAMHSINNYKTFDVCIGPYITINNAICQYMQKVEYDAKNIMAYVYTDDSFNDCDTSLNDLYKKFQAQSNNLYYKVNTYLNNKQNLFTNICTLLIDNIAYFRDSISVNYVSDDKHTNDNLNIMIHTHESLWRLIANNELIQGNAYDMLYYPKYNTNLDEQYYLSRSVSNNEVKANVVNMQQIKSEIDLTKQTYNQFPYIITLTATSKNSFSPYVKISSYKEKITQYVNYLQHYIKYNTIINKLRKYSYYEIFSFVNAKNQMYPVLLDCACDESNRVILTLYDHQYGYIFILANDIDEIFLLKTNKINAYVFNPLDRYNLTDIHNHKYNVLTVNDFFLRVIFKKSFDSGHWTSCNYDNMFNISTYSYNSILLFCTLYMKNATTELSGNGLYNTKDFYFGNTYKYINIDRYIKYDKWEIEYDYDSNSINYLKDEFNNVADYDFRNKKSDFFNCDYTYSLFNSSTAGLMYFYRDSSMSSQDALIYQSLNNLVNIYGNKISNSNNVAFLYYGDGQVTNNTVYNSEKTVVYLSDYINVESSKNVFIKNSSIINANNTNTVLMQNSYSSDLINNACNVMPNIVVNNNYTTVHNASLFQINNMKYSLIKGNDLNSYSITGQYLTIKNDSPSSKLSIPIPPLYTSSKRIDLHGNAYDKYNNTRVPHTLWQFPTVYNASVMCISTHILPP